MDLRFEAAAANELYENTKNDRNITQKTQNRPTNRLYSGKYTMKQRIISKGQNSE